MPWKVEHDGRCGKSKPWAVIKETDGSLVACHPTKAAAMVQLRALYASEEKAMDEPVLEKNGDMPVPYGVTTFAALEAARKVSDAAEYVQELTEQLQSLSANICANPDIADKPGALRALADEFAGLIRSHNSAAVKDMPEEKGIGGIGSALFPPGLGNIQFVSSQHAQLYAEVDRLLALIMTANETDKHIVRQQLADLLASAFARKALEADPARAALVEEFAGAESAEVAPDEDAAKATWDTAYVNNLPDSAFLYVEAGDKEDGKTVPRSKRHFPYKNAQGEVDLPHLRNAIARIPQSNAPGLSAEKKAALQERARKMLANAQKEGRGVFGRVVDAVKDWLAEPADPQPQPAFVLWKEASGNYRWLATYSNKWRDRDRPPEILSEASHREFVKAVDAKEWPAPELWLWHVDGTRWGAADWTAYADGFALASGLVDKESAAIAERLEVYPEPLAVSHGMPVREIVRDADDPTVITRYRTREISVLPAWAAANALTGFQVMEVKEMAIPADKKDFLRAAGLSDERVAAIEAELEGKAKEAADAGLEFKAAETPPVSGTEQPPDTQKKDETPAIEPAVDNAPPAPAPVAAALTAQDVAAAVREVLQPFEQRLAALETLKEQVTALNKSEDERVNEALAATPAASLADLLRGAGVSGRAIGSKEARIDGRGSLAKSKPAEADAPDNALQITGVPFIDTILGTGRPQ